MVHTEGEVLKLYPRSSCSSHLWSGFINIIKRYGMRVSPCMVPLLISIGGVVPKWLPVNVVVNLVHPHLLASKSNLFCVD